MGANRGLLKNIHFSCSVSVTNLEHFHFIFLRDIIERLQLHWKVANMRMHTQVSSCQEGTEQWSMVTARYVYEKYTVYAADMASSKS